MSLSRLCDLLQSFPPRFLGFDVHADHVDVVVVHAVGDVARVGADAQPRQLLHFPLEALAEEVVDHGIVHSGALCKHAGQQTDLRWDFATVIENGPKAYQPVWRPAAYETYADQNGNL